MKKILFLHVQEVTGSSSNALHKKVCELNGVLIYRRKLVDTLQKQCRSSHSLPRKIWTCASQHAVVCRKTPRNWSLKSYRMSRLNILPVKSTHRERKKTGYRLEVGL
ncbi:uncharacterized protein LOC143694149 [Agelaius phoeniceus]|uniref:uncharacterized protein LOC143694149 n=1 Tax=Agelaius phoeniceus TaxID=39638 RepID=UPI0040551BA0